MKRQRRVVVFKEDQYNGDWPPMNAVECVSWFAKKLEEIPLEFRASAVIDIDSVSSYDDCHYALIEIYYERLETDEEVIERERKEQLHKEALRQSELQTLAMLQKKYNNL